MPLFDPERRLQAGRAREIKPAFIRRRNEVKLIQILMQLQSWMTLYQGRQYVKQLWFIKEASVKKVLLEEMMEVILRLNKLMTVVGRDVCSPQHEMFMREGELTCCWL